MPSRDPNHWDVIIVGAGGAGLMCAIFAGRRERRVLVLDHSDTLGGKILISGGGKCNFTNISVSAQNYVSENSHFCKSALSRYTPDDFIQMVKDYDIAFHEKKLGQLFCDKSARSIVEMLKTECQKANVEIKLETKIESISRETFPSKNFSIKCHDTTYTCESLVVATGGLSIPQIGASPFGYRIAEQFGLKVTKLFPALDGFVFSEKEVTAFAELAGLSIDCTLECNGVAFRENILFTHKGLSGPAALQGSLYWRDGDTIQINCLPEIEVGLWLKEKKQQGIRTSLKKLFVEFLPTRFVEFFFAFNQIKDLSLQESSDKFIETLGAHLNRWTLTPSGTVGFNKAEVTRGGIDTNDLSSKTMESKKVPGLYFIGEVVDVTGWLGGYNFQWAWSSGWAAGQVV